MTEIVLSGLRPTGRVHLGNYFGAVKNWVDLEESGKYRCFFFVADLHALTTDYADTEGLAANTREAVLDWLAVGVDPQRATVFLQSRVPQHAELALYFSMITPLGWLERVPTYKDQIEQLRSRDLGTHGFLGYPVLMTADIAVYRANLVPVGEDQASHLEICREIVRRFNGLYGEVFPEPKALYTPTPKVNGIDGRTGGYLLPSIDVAQLARIALGYSLPATERDEVDLKLGANIDYPLKEGEDPNDLSQAGWAVVFAFARKGSEAATHQAAIREALGPLLALRRSQAARRDDRRYRECVGPDAYRPGETKQQFLTRMGAGPGAVDPQKFPYYVLLVASPEEIPYRVQYQLDVQYAVGRIHFDTIDEYAHYAANVVEAETRPAPTTRSVALWGVENPDDRATRASARHLVAPLADYLERDQADRWQVTRFIGEDATKARLASLLGGNVPSLLVTASHGVGFPAGDPRQRSDQGALLCQDWAGPRSGSLTSDHYFAGDDIAADADLRGLVGFHFACFGAGTPRYDDFSRKGDASALVDIAPHAFVARLPQRMLGRAHGALADCKIGRHCKCGDHRIDQIGVIAGKQAESVSHRVVDAGIVEPEFQMPRLLLGAGLVQQATR
jgi:hypothetical protein